MARDTRTRILDTAERLFATRGVEGVAVTEIEDGAGLSPGSGSFYRHFRSKDDVLSAVVTREIDRAVERSARRTATSTDLVTDFGEALRDLDAMHPLVALLIRQGSRLPHLDRIRSVLADGGAHLDAERLAERMRAGEIPTRDAEGVAAVVLCALVGQHLASRFFGGPVGVDGERFVAALAALVGGP